MDQYSEIIIYLYSYLPAILLGAFFWWLDRFEREPLFVVILAFFWGAFGAGILSFFWNTFIHVAIEFAEVGHVSNSNVTTIVVAPFVEELTKGIFIFLLLKLNQVDNISDGILLGICVGLGFAAAENVFYAKKVFRMGGELAMWDNLWFREIHTTLLHASATAVWGGMLGYSRYFKKFAHYFTIINGFILAMVTHGFWNMMATFAGGLGNENAVVKTLMKFELFLIFGMLLTLFLVTIRKQSDLIIRELLEESENGVIPVEHVGFFASMVRKAKGLKISNMITPEEYAQLGVKLAFRKFEYRVNPSRRLLNEIKSLRKKLKRAAGYDPESLKLSYGKDQ